MKNLPREKLYELISNNRNLCDDPARVGALLNDASLGEYRLGRNVLMLAQREGVATEDGAGIRNHADRVAGIPAFSATAGYAWHGYRDSPLGGGELGAGAGQTCSQ